MRFSPVAAILLLTSLLSCGTASDVNAILETDDPVYLQIDTAEKAKLFYRNKTVFLQRVEFVGLDGKVAADGRVPSRFTVRANGFSAEYYAPDGTAYLAFSGKDKVYTGTWSIKSSRGNYPQICSSFPELSSTACKPPRDHLERKSKFSNLYPGDVLNLSGQRFPAGTRNIDLSASIETVVRSLGAGSPRPIKTTQ